MPVGRYHDPVETVDDLQFYPRLLGQWQQKVIGPVQQLACVDWSKFGLGSVVQVQHIVDRRRKSTQPSLHMLDPTAALAFKIRFREQSGKKFEAAERVAYFMRQQCRHLDQRLLPSQLLAIAMSALLAHEIRNPLGSLELFA